VKRKGLLAALREALGLEPTPPQAPLHSEVRAAPPPPQAQPAAKPAAARPAPPVAREPSAPAVRPPQSQRIMWEQPRPTQSAAAPKPARPQSGGSGRIDWGGGTDGAVSAVANLVGVEDAFEHTPLQPGETVAYCTRDKVAYHLSTWQFLRAQNQARCCVCGMADAIVTQTLPGTPPTVPAPATPFVRPTVPVMPGEKVIGLGDVPSFVGRAVLVEAFVYEVYQTAATGTYFVRFQPRQYGDAPF